MYSEEDKEEPEMVKKTSKQIKAEMREKKREIKRQKWVLSILLVFRLRQIQEEAQNRRDEK